MSKYSKIVIFVLAATNIAWAYVFFDTINVRKDAQAYMAERDHVIHQMAPMLEQLMSELSRTEIIGLSRNYNANNVIEKGSCIFVGFLGYNFSEDGKLLKVYPSIDLSPGECPSGL